MQAQPEMLQSRDLSKSISRCLGLDEEMARQRLNDVFAFRQLTDNQWEMGEETNAVVDEMAASSKNCFHMLQPEIIFPDGTYLMISAFCVPIVHSGFDEKYRERPVIFVCPEFDGIVDCRERLAEILRRNRPESLTVNHIETPCCVEIALIARQALRFAKLDVRYREVTYGLKGQVLRYARFGSLM